MTDDAAGGSLPGRPVRARRRGALVVLALGAVVVGGAALIAFRYLPALDDARVLRTGLEATVERVREAGLGIDRATLDAVGADLAIARGRYERLASLLAGDPLIAVARIVPLLSSNVRGADGVVAAAGGLLDAADDGLAIGRRFVEIRATQAANPAGTSTLAQLVALMATSRDRATAAAASVASARRELTAVPDGLFGPIASARDAMATRIDVYGPLLDSYVDASARLPAILGWDGPRRYLVLTQDPAELRPSGGFISMYGIVAFDRGRLTEYRFQPTEPLDIPWDYPRIEPPQELADYLLGPKQPWQLADAGWSPDYPTSAADALRLYANESGDTRIDGVFAITTLTIDELLTVTGPVEVPAYGVTVATGETTLTSLLMTRAPATPGTHRKAFLSAFATRLLDALLALPPASWGDLIGTADAMRRSHLLLAWFRDPADEALVTRSGFGGAVRQDPGDYVFPVESNVAPATKLEWWTSRTLALDVSLDAAGNARNTLEATWDNGVDTPSAAPYRSMTGVGGKILGVYFRLLVPERSRVEEVAGGGIAPVTNPATIDTEAGRTVIGTYIKIPPGTTSLRQVWTSPYAATTDAGRGAYRLTVQHQAGSLPSPLTITIEAPPGSRITAASPGLVVDGSRATLATTLDGDIVVAIEYAAAAR